MSLRSNSNNRYSYISSTLTDDDNLSSFDNPPPTVSTSRQRRLYHRPSKVSSTRPNSITMGRKLGTSMVFDKNSIPVKVNNEQVNPLPIIPLTVLAFSMLSEFLSASVSAPFMFIMVSTFSITRHDESLVGYYTGILGASFFLSQFITALMWSNFSENYGRRFTLFVSLFGNALCTALFGLCSNFSEAIFIRLLQGLFSGAVGVSRSSVKVITDNTNESRAYGILSFFWGFGSICGPIIGGLFESPVDRYPNLIKNDSFKSFFSKFPYSLPCLVAASILLFGSSLTLFINRDAGPLFKQGIKLKNDDEEEVNKSEYRIVNFIDKIVRFFKSFRSYSKLERMSNGTAYGYNRADSVRDSTINVNEVNDVNNKSRMSFAQRLLLAQEENVVSITDLWVQSALTREVEEQAVEDQEHEINSTYCPDNDNEHENDNEDEEEDFDRRTLDLNESNANDDHHDVEQLSESNAEPSSVRSNRGRSFRRATSFGMSSIDNSSERHSYGSNFGDKLATLGAIPRTSKLRSWNNNNRIGSFSNISRPKSILDNVGLSPRHSYIGIEEGEIGGEEGSRLGPIPESSDANNLNISDNQGTTGVEISLMVKLILFQYSFLALHNTTFDQLFTTFLLTDYNYGGLSLTPSHFSTLIAMMAGFSIFYQFYAYGKLGPPNGRFSHLQMFRISAIIYIIVYSSTPLLRNLVRRNVESDFLVMMGMVILTGIRYGATTAAYTSITILINVMSPPSISGVTNAYGQSAVAFSRFIGPILGGTLWKFTTSGNYEGYSIGFQIVSIMASIAFLQSFLIR